LFVYFAVAQSKIILGNGLFYVLCGGIVFKMGVLLIGFDNFFENHDEQL